MTKRAQFAKVAVSDLGEYVRSMYAKAEGYELTELDAMEVIRVIFTTMANGGGKYDFNVDTKKCPECGGTLDTKCLSCLYHLD